MNKADIIARISMTYPYMSAKNIDKVLNIIFNSIALQLKNNGRVELRDFGTFCVRHREESIGRNPRNGEKVIVAAKKVPFFKAGKKLKDLINGRIILESRRDRMKRGK